MHTSEHYELIEEPELRLVKLTRTSRRYEHVHQVRSEVDALVACFTPRHRSWSIIVDMRAAPPRNDLDFEEAMRHLRFAVGRAFGRVVVLVATASGEMQVTRLHREAGSQYLIARTLEEARQLAAGGARTASARPASLHPSSIPSPGPASGVGFGNGGS